MNTTITERHETYWTNKYGGRFCNELAAREDEQVRDSAEWMIKVIGTPIGERGYPSNVLGDGYLAIDDSKAPWTGQPDGKCRVYLFKDMIKNMQTLIDKHGENVGYTKHHCGIGSYCEEMVILYPFDGKGEPISSSVFPIIFNK